MFAGITAATVIGASSVAFACLVTRGQITLTGDQRAGDTVKASDGATFHGFCYNPTIAAKAASPGQVTVAVAPTTCGTTNSQLPDSSTYQVVLQTDAAKFAWTRTNTSTAWAWNTVANNGCFGSNLPATVTLATTFNVVNGAATGTFTVPGGVAASGTNDAHSICVGYPGQDGAFAPLVTN
jgi:hypothetical protein